MSPGQAIGWPVLGFALALGAVEVGDVILPPLIQGTASVDGPVMAGGEVLVTWTIDKATDCPGSTARVWSGEDGFFMAQPYQPTALPEGAGVYPIPTMIPALAPPGELTLKIRGYFDCAGAPRRYFELGPVVMQVANESGM